MAVSMKDVALKTGISASTVSRVLNNKGTISEATAKRVLEAVADMNYIPNNVARSLKQNKTLKVGIIIPDISESMFTQVIKGIDSVLSEEGYSIILCDTNERPEKEEKLIGILRESQVDGIIIATVQDGAQLDAIFNNCSVPAVFIDNIPNMKKNNFDAVGLDNIRASYLAVDYLASLGHSRIACIMGKQSEFTGYERYMGFLHAMQTNKLCVDPELVRYGDYKEDSGYINMKDLINLREKGCYFSAVYIVSSKMTYGAISALREMNLSTPDDFSLIGFDVHDEHKLIMPQVTTIVQPEKEIGVMAARLLLDRMKGDKKDSISQRVVLEPILDKKATCLPMQQAY